MFKIFSPPNGEMSEWSNERDWKSRIGQKPIGGSNPPLSASLKPAFSLSLCIAPQGLR